MNNELRDGLVKLVDKLNSGIEKGADFAIEQAPLVVQEFILRERITTTVWFVVGVAMVLAVYPAARYWWRQSSGWWSGDVMRDENLAWFRMATASWSIAAFSTGAFLACRSLSPMVTAWFAPRVFILEEIARLVNGR